jgi:O-succinylbenzoate synthase
MTRTVNFDRVTARLVSLPLSSGFLSARTSLQEREIILVTVHSDGLTGWGEAAPVPGHTRQDVGKLWEELGARARADGLAVVEHSDGLLAAAFAEAFADLDARREGRPLCHTPGTGHGVPASAAIGVDRNGDPDRHLLGTAAASGYRFAKLKVTPETKPATVAAVIDDYPLIRFAVDANGSLGPGYEPLLGALDALGLEYIEQPGPHGQLEFHRRLRAHLATAISLDESAASVDGVRHIVATGAADIVNLKVGRFGPAITLELADEIVSAGLRARIGGLIETGVGRAHAVAVATYPQFSVVGDIAGSDRYLTDDLVRPQWRVSNGELPIPDGPGIAVTVDEEAVADHTIATLTVP